MHVWMGCRGACLGRGQLGVKAKHDEGLVEELWRCVVLIVE